MTDITGKTAFITGGASGLGFSMARAFASRGANVMLADIDEAGLAVAAEKLRAETNAEIDHVVCDVSRAEAVRAGADAVVDRFGKVHIVVNHAGVAINGKPGTIALEDWRWIVDINLLGVVYGVEVFTPLIQAHGEGGHFINTASMAGHIANAGMSPYFATKFAVVGYSEALALEFAKENINVSCLCPAWVKTNIHNTGFAKPSGGPSKEEAKNDPAYQEMSAVVNGGLDPDAVGEWVADCVEANRLHIFTHPEFKPFIDARSAAVSADYKAIIDDGRFG